MQSRKVKSLSHPFKILRNGKDDELATELFNSSWFHTFLSYAQDSEYYGYSLIAITDVVDGKPVLELVPRKHVKPAQRLIVQNTGDTTGYDYTSADFADFYIGIGEPDSLGLLLNAAPLALLKNRAALGWAQYIELFGQPIRLGKTTISNQDSVDAMYNALQNMSSAAFGVIDANDSIEFAESVKANGDVYAGFVKWVNEEISKTFLGGTMQSDNGSSRSQSEVHERLADTYSAYDLKKLTFWVNDLLIPKLINLGLDLTNCTFQFYELEDTASLFDMSVKLLQSGMQIEPTWFETKFNIPVTKAIAPVDKVNFQKPE